MQDQPIHAARLYEQVVARIETQILNGEFHPGDRLPNERELAEKFRVSRTVVREAVKTLREKGLVSSEQGRGTFVTDGTSRAARDSLGRMMQIGTTERADDLVEARELFEPEIAALAAKRATRQDLADLNAIVATMDRTIDDADAFIEADLAFHLALARATQNAFIPTLLDPIVDLLREHRKKIFLVNGAPRGQSHHKKILKAICAHDPQTAREAMRAHLRQVRRDSEK
ncbi:MAG: FadR family transcriptional regulator [Chloroflexi bacterium]|nr:FadR family transcriptional regulator [Chloroflexota bacterium]